jgi:hypothetical protein
MTGEEALHTLLAAIQDKANENDKRDTVLMSQLESVVKRALGIPEEQIVVPEFNQAPVKGEFPQWRVKYEGGKEVARRAIYSRYELEALFREDRMFSSVDFCTPVPAKEGS